MKVKVTMLDEREDGGANVQLDMDKEGKEFLVQKGFEITLMMAIDQLPTSDQLDAMNELMAQTNKELEAEFVSDEEDDATEGEDDGEFHDSDFWGVPTPEEEEAWQEAERRFNNLVMEEALGYAGVEAQIFVENLGSEAGIFTLRKAYEMGYIRGYKDGANR